jgi:hypothetical protein
MAVKFQKGAVVVLNLVQPCGPVIDFRVDPNGDMWYLVEWVDAAGNTQQRWFAEAVLAAKE